MPLLWVAGMSAHPQHFSPLSHLDSADLLDALSTGILVLDAQLCVIYANVGAQDLLATGLQMTRGRPLPTLFADGDVLRGLLDRSLARGETCAGHEVRLLPIGMPADSEPAIVDLIVTPLGGSITGTHLLVECADARTRQRIAREVEMLSRVSGSRLMLRELAHEIKNPLGGLRGAAQLLEREVGHGDLREYTSIIIREADRLRALVDRMLGPSQPPHKEVVNLHEICEHVYQLLRSEAGSAVTVERDYDPSLPEGMLDRHEIIQALLNVARNALQAVSGHVAEPRIILRSRVLSGASIGLVRHRMAANLQVEDNGPGVPTELHRTLFFPLVTGRANGTGLGLAVAQDLVTRHGGIVEFESRPGRTIFSILLPLEIAP